MLTIDSGSQFADPFIFGAELSAKKKNIPPTSNPRVSISLWQFNSAWEMKKRSPCLENFPTAGKNRLSSTQSCPLDIQLQKWSVRNLLYGLQLDFLFDCWLKVNADFFLVYLTWVLFFALLIDKSCYDPRR